MLRRRSQTPHSHRCYHSSLRHWEKWEAYLEDLAIRETSRVSFTRTRLSPKAQARERSPLSHRKWRGQWCCANWGHTKEQLLQYRLGPPVALKRHILWQGADLWEYYRANSRKYRAQSLQERRVIRFLWSVKKLQKADRGQALRIKRKPSCAKFHEWRESIRTWRYRFRNLKGHNSKATADVAGASLPDRQTNHASQSSAKAGTHETRSGEETRFDRLCTPSHLDRDEDAELGITLLKQLWLNVQQGTQGWNRNWLSRWF